MKDKLSQVVHFLEDIQGRVDDKVAQEIGDLLFSLKDAEFTKGYRLTYDELGVATCAILRQKCADYWEVHPKTYPVDLYKQFLKYWSEPDGKGKPRWIKEKTFHIPGRLATWFKNYKPSPVEVSPEKKFVQ